MKSVPYQSIKVGDVKMTARGKSGKEANQSSSVAPLIPAYKTGAPIFQEHPTVLTQPENTHTTAGVPTQYAVDLKR